MLSLLIIDGDVDEIINFRLIITTDHYNYTAQSALKVACPLFLATMHIQVFVAILAVFFLDSFSWAVPIAIGNKRWDEADTKLAVFEASSASSPGEVCGTFIILFHSF